MSPRAPKICSTPACSALMPCPEHAPKPWASSKRSERTISGSAQQKRAKRIMRRDERRCHYCGLPAADEVDHCIPLAEGGADDDSNMAPIHRACHIEKTALEAQRGRARATA